MFPYQIPLTKGTSLPDNGARKESWWTTRVPRFGMTCIEWVLCTLFECRHVPKGKDMQWIWRFPSLRCLALPESYMGYWEKIGNRKSEQSKHKNNMNMSFPSKDMWLLSSLNTKHLGSLFDLIIYLSLFYPFDMIKLWCELSLSLWRQFPRRGLLECESK